MIDFNCPICGKTISLPDSASGRSGTCSCGERMRVPKLPESKHVSMLSVQSSHTSPKNIDCKTNQTPSRNKRLIWIATGCIVFILSVLGIFTWKSLQTPIAVDPLSQFKRIAEAVGEIDFATQKYIDERPVIDDFDRKNESMRIFKQDLIDRYDQGKRYVKIFAWTREVSYDVEKTTSLVSPYTAHLQFVYYHIASDWMIKDASDKITLADCKESARREEYKCLFAYQEDKWVLLKVLNKDEITRNWSPATLPSQLQAVVFRK